MAMEDVLPTLFLIGLIYLIFRWFSKPSQPGTPGEAVIRGVTRSMVDTVHSAFPDIPAPNIIYSLSRTRSAQATSEQILERGFLPAPPASFSVPASLLPAQPAAAAVPTTGQPAKAAPATKSQTLIDRFNLSSKLPSPKGKEKDPLESPSQMGIEAEAKNEWAATKEKREQELRERKERMILEARRRLLEKQSKETAA